MGSFGDYAENAVLDWLFGSGDPATWYIGLSTADPTDDGSGIAEPSGGSYARVAVTNNATNWPAASGGAKANGTAITFPQASASWGTVTHFVIMDAASDGNMYVHAALDASKTVDSGDTLSFAVGELDITLD